MVISFLFLLGYVLIWAPFMWCEDRKEDLCQGIPPLSKTNGPDGAA